MKWILILLIIVFIVWRMKPPKGVRSIQTTALKPMLADKKKQFIDVRTVAEYKARHISQFKNIPLNTLPNELSKLDSEKETIVICQSGMRSLQAARQLSKAGFTNIVNVPGGMNAWRD